MDKVITSTAPQYPATAVLSDAQLKLTTKSGMASGTPHNTDQSAVTTTDSRTVFHGRWSVRGRSMSDATVCTPAPCASTNKNARGSNKIRATRRLTRKSQVERG